MENWVHGKKTVHTGLLNQGMTSCSSLKEVPMSKHTPGPWCLVIDGEENKYRIISEYTEENIYGIKLHRRATIIQLNTFKRIVACVNAMEGIDDPKQWVAMARSHMDASSAQSDQNKRLKSERDDLLEALKELVDLKKMKDEAGECPESLPSDYIERKPMAWENARRAIRKAEGGKP